MSPTGLCGECLAVLFFKVVETLGGGAYLEELGHWECVFEGYKLVLGPFLFLGSLFMMRKPFCHGLLLSHSLPHHTLSVRAEAFRLKPLKPRDKR